MSTTSGTDLFFREVQPFRGCLPWLIIIAVSAMMWLFLLGRLFKGRPVGPNPMPDSVLILFWLVFGLAFPIAGRTSRLITEVGPEAVYVQFFPLQARARQIPFETIETCESVSYEPLREFGGWGIRFGWDGRAYSVSGNGGVRLTLSDGSQVLLGSTQPETLANAITDRLH